MMKNNFLRILSFSFLFISCSNAQIDSQQFNDIHKIVNTIFKPKNSQSPANKNMSIGIISDLSRSKEFQLTKLFNRLTKDYLKSMELETRDSTQFIKKESWDLNPELKTKIKLDFNKLIKRIKLVDSNEERLDFHIQIQSVLFNKNHAVIHYDYKDRDYAILLKKENNNWKKIHQLSYPFLGEE
jgi:hypothetical protein